MNKIIALREHQIYLNKLNAVASELPYGLENERGSIEDTLKIFRKKSEEVLENMSMDFFKKKTFFVSDLLALAGFVMNEDFYHNEDELSLNHFRMMQEIIPSVKQENVFCYSLYPENDDTLRVIEISVIVAKGNFILNVVSDAANPAGLSFSGKNEDAISIFQKALKSV